MRLQEATANQELQVFEVTTPPDTICYRQAIIQQITHIINKMQGIGVHRSAKIYRRLKIRHISYHLINIHPR